MSVTYALLDFTGIQGYRVGDDGSLWTRIVLRQKTAGRSGNHGVLGPTWRRMSPSQCKKTRRMIVTLAFQGKRLCTYVHKLVLLAFVGPCPKGMQACHFPDRDPGNNALSNLRWDYPKANHADAVIHGTKGPGELHPRTTISEATVRNIRSEAYMLQGTKGWRNDLARKYGVTLRNLKHILARTSWYHI